MSFNQAADRLFQYSLAMLLVFVAWGNPRGLIAVSLVSAVVSAVFAMWNRRSLSRAGLLSLIISILTAAALAFIAWKG
ncbi:MAG: hypothetical protein QUS35_02765 [bacterium]|nr:hypothetical protein [bacterium]